MRAIRPIPVFLVLVFAALVEANDTVSPAEQAVPLLFTGATFHTVSGDAIPDGRMLVADGIIAALGAKDTPIEIPAGTETIDLRNNHVYPAMIAANSVVGLSEIPSIGSTVDIGETGDINPGARAEVSVNPDSELIPVTRANGVLFTLTAPRSSLLAGTSALLRLDGWTWEEMTVKAPVGMHVHWPDLVVASAWTSPTDDDALKKLDKEYTEKLQRLDEAFATTRAYSRARQADPPAAFDTAWEAMAPVVGGNLPVFVHAQTVAQIRDALAFCARQEITGPVIVGGLDAARVIGELKHHGAAVILSQINSLPQRRWESSDAAFTVAARLHEAGIPFCIANSGTPFDAPNERNLPYQAARAVAHGLPADIGLRAVTLYPAQILGLADRLGSLEPGKEATFLVTDGNPLEIRTTIAQAYSRGRKLDLSSKHTRLYEKYLEKYRQLPGGQ